MVQLFSLARQFGESFTFGGSDLNVRNQLPFVSTLLKPFVFYGIGESTLVVIFFCQCVLCAVNVLHYNLQINENGILSFRAGFFNIFPEEFDSIFNFQPLIAPLWAYQCVGPDSAVLYRNTSDEETLERAQSLVRQHFSGVDFEPLNVTVITWFNMSHKSGVSPSCI